MCGFVVHAGCSDSRHRLSVAERMLATIRHRGPDDEGIVDDGLATVGFRRLSILDLSSHGHQPMTSPDGRLTIVFNGEIYNYLELRTQLQALGHTFESSGDTEVLLRAYAEWGNGCVTRMNGMWAFVIIDRRNRTLFGARDRFGIKPLFRWTNGKQTLLASEIKAIQASSLYCSEIDTNLAADYLLDGRLDETSRTLFRGIEQLAPAHCFELYADGTFRQWVYWRLEDYTEQVVANPAERFAALFEDSVALHMRSDVPVGVHLSGGLDSSSIACAAARVRVSTCAHGPLVAFSFIDQDFDETRFIEDTIAQTGAAHIRLTTDGLRVWNDLRRVLSVQDEPVHSLTAVIGFQLMQLTAEHGIRVILNGQGADETLGGYPSYFRDGWVTELVQHGLPSAWREVASYAAARGESAMALFKGLLIHVLKSRLRRVPGYRRLALSRYRSARVGLGGVRPELAAMVTGLPTSTELGLRSSLLHSIRHDPLPLYLRVEDRNSMAHSIEARVPFLDHRLVEFEMTMSRAWRLDGDLNKVLLRKAMLGRIPSSVLERREKMGFPTPTARWLRGPMADHVLELLQSPSSIADLHLDRNRLIAMLCQHRTGQADHSSALVRAVQWILWTELKIKRNGPSAPQPNPHKLM